MISAVLLGVLAVLWQVNKAYVRIKELEKIVEEKDKLVGIGNWRKGRGFGILLVDFNANHLVFKKFAWYYVSLNIGG